MIKQAGFFSAVLASTIPLRFGMLFNQRAVKSNRQKKTQ